MTLATILGFYHVAQEGRGFYTQVAREYSAEKMRKSEVGIVPK